MQEMKRKKRIQALSGQSPVTGTVVASCLLIAIESNR